MNIMLFIIVLVASFIIVRIGAIAFQLTGLEWSLAKFQALSCFTSTGFTTKEAELVTGNRQRRRIASTLIVLGHAGLVTMIATLANSLRAQEVLESRLSKPILPLPLRPFFAQLINLVIIIAAVYAMYKVFTNTKILRRLTNALRRRIVKREMIEPVSFEELAVVTGGFGVSKVAVDRQSQVLDKTLSEAPLRKHNITVLAIVRGTDTIPNPPADSRISLGDELLCFGKLENIKSVLYAGNG